MIWFFIIIFSLYLIFLGYTLYQWLALPSLFQSDFKPATKVSVIIPVRNEAANIQQLLSDLHQQDYPKDLYEVIVVNDNSMDDTENKIRQMMGEVDYSLQIINLSLPQNFNGSSKKLAISQAIDMATGDLIVTTDGDCRANQQWLRYLCYPFQELNAVFIAAPVTFNQEKTFFQQLQTIEFASLIVSGAVAISANRPNMCNGANLAYSKKAFYMVKGYQGNEGIASGDDEFLLQKISNQFSPDQIFYQKSKQAIINTAPQDDWQAFSQQRKRWAGKWKKHRNAAIIVLAIFIFLFHLSFLTGIAHIIIQSNHRFILLLFILLKILLEFILLKNALQFLNKKLNLLKFMVLQILYSFYVIYFGIAANFGSFNWKGRTYKN